MNLVLLKKRAVPLSTQLYEQIRAAVSSGKIKAGECLPSIRSLARELEVSVITVKLAYEKLESDGLIYTHGGKGCFVSESDEEKRLAKARALEMAKRAVEYCRDSGCTEEETASMLKEVFGQKKKD